MLTYFHPVFLVSISLIQLIYKMKKHNLFLNLLQVGILMKSHFRIQEIMLFRDPNYSTTDIDYKKDENRNVMIT